MLFCFIGLFNSRDNGDNLYHVVDGKDPEANGISFRVSPYGSWSSKQRKSLNRNPRKFPLVRGCSRECVNIEFAWNFNRSFVKTIVSRAVPFIECPLRELTR